MRGRVQWNWNFHETFCRSRGHKMRPFLIILGVLLPLLCSIPSGGFPFQSSGVAPIPESSSDNVECFLDYMELWVPRKMMDGLLLWLSRVMRFPVSLSSLDRSNHLLSRCRYALDMDNNSNYIFRVHYSACNVQTQKGFHTLEILMVKKTSSGKSQSNRYILKCPALTAALGREKVRCDPTYVQVSRPLPLGNSDVQDWYLTFRGELVVAVEDASLFGVEVEINDDNVTVRGLRGQLLNPRQFLDRQTDVLPLWMAHGFYAYSLEASCPPVTQHPGEEVVVYIPKQRVGLVKRGSYTTETLTLRNIVASQAISITVTEDKQFVMVNIPANEILQQKYCSSTGNPQTIHRVQAYYSIDLVLEFAEIAYPMNWTLENYYECSDLPPKTAPEANRRVNFAANMTVNKTRVDQQSRSQISPTITPLSANTTLFSLYTQESKLSFITGSSVTEMSHKHFGESTDSDFSGSGDHSEFQLYENKTLESSDLGSGSRELHFDIPLSKAYNENKHLLELSRSYAVLTGTSLPAEIAERNGTMSINNTNQGKTTHQPTEGKEATAAQQEGIEKFGFRPDTLTANLINNSETINQLQVFPKFSTAITRPVSGADSWEMLPGDMQELDETAKENLSSLSPRGHQIRSGRESAEELKMTKKHENAEDLKPIPRPKGQNLQPEDAQSLSEASTGHHPPPPLSKNPPYSVVWSTSNHHTEEILNETANEMEMTVSDEQLLLATPQKPN